MQARPAWDDADYGARRPTQSITAVGRARRGVTAPRRGRIAPSPPKEAIVSHTMPATSRRSGTSASKESRYRWSSSSSVSVTSASLLRSMAILLRTATQPCYFARQNISGDRGQDHRPQYPCHIARAVAACRCRIPTSGRIVPGDTGHTMPSLPGPWSVRFDGSPRSFLSRGGERSVHTTYRGSIMPI